MSRNSGASKRCPQWPMPPWTNSPVFKYSFESSDIICSFIPYSNSMRWVPFSSAYNVQGNCYAKSSHVVLARHRYACPLGSSGSFHFPEMCFTFAEYQVPWILLAMMPSFSLCLRGASRNCCSAAAATPCQSPINAGSSHSGLRPETSLCLPHFTSSRGPGSSLSPCSATEMRQWFLMSSSTSAYGVPAKGWPSF